MTDTKNSNGDLYVGEGVIVNAVAQVPGRAVVNGQFDGGIDAKEIEVQGAEVFFAFFVAI